MKSIKDILADRSSKTAKRNISQEYQDYGIRLAQALNDEKHKSLYIKLAKEKPRNHLENAKEFVLDYYGAKNKARIFMWKLKELAVDK